MGGEGQLMRRGKAAAGWEESCCDMGESCGEIGRRKLSCDRGKAVV
jgi:hypothetical protein